MNLFSLSAKGYADSDFPGLLRDGVRGHSVDADAGEEQGEQSEKAGDLSDQALVHDRSSDFLCHRSSVGNGKVRIDLGHGCPNGRNGSSRFTRKANFKIAEVLDP